MPQKLILIITIKNIWFEKCVINAKFLQQHWLIFLILVIDIHFRCSILSVKIPIRMIERPRPRKGSDDKIPFCSKDKFNNFIIINNSHVKLFLYYYIVKDISLYL